jgi:anti-anti-sigma factor
LTNGAPWSIRIVDGDDVVYVVLAGDLGRAAADEVDRQLRAEGFRVPLMLDLGQVTYLDSYGLRSLLLLHRGATAAGGSVTIIEASLAVRRVLDLSGTGAWFGLPPAR